MPGNAVTMAPLLGKEHTVRPLALLELEAAKNGFRDCLGFNGSSGIEILPYTSAMLQLEGERDVSPDETAIDTATYLDIRSSRDTA